MKDYNLVFSKETVEFTTVAKEFVAFLEAAKDFSSDSFIDTNIKILPLLYLKGSLIPQVPDYDEDYYEKFVTEADWTFIQQVTAAKLGEHDEYAQVQDASLMNSVDFYNVSLSELFADLYQDMGDYVAAYQTANDELILSALYYCKQNFETYWGIRLLILLQHLHRIKYMSNE